MNRPATTASVSSQRSRRIFSRTCAQHLAAAAVGLAVVGGNGDAQTLHPPRTSSDICEIGDVATMSGSSENAINFAGTWVLDLSRSQGLPALWRNARSATLIVAQDAERVTPVLTIFGRSDAMPYDALSYRLDGNLQHARSGPKEQTRVTSELRYDGRAIVLTATELVLVKDGDLLADSRATDPALRKDIELLHQTTQRWELADDGGSLGICRVLEAPLTRTVSKLLFVRK